MIGTHISSSGSRDKILTFGLLPRHPESGGPLGVYVFTDPDAIRLFRDQYAVPGDSYDVWEVRLDHLRTDDDQAWPGQAVVVYSRIYPERIRMITHFTES